MRTSDTISQESLDRWSTGAFVAAGLLWLGDAALLGSEVMGLYAHGLLNGVFIISALLATMIGLLGFYPRLSDQMPRLALVNGAVAAIAAVGLVVTVVWQFAAMALSGVSTPPGLTAIPPLVALVVFGVAILYSDVPSRAIGAFLLIYLAVLVAAIGTSEWLQFALAALLGGVGLVIGYVHHDGVGPLESPEPISDSTT
jgi:uncharacterized membrane protein YidH (DUF202 family)